MAERSNDIGVEFGAEYHEAEQKDKERIGNLKNHLLLSENKKSNR